MKYLNRLKSEDANALVENIIILPIVFFVIFFMIIGSFIIHDKITLDAAVERGATYASKCIADPYYAKILKDYNTQAGVLDADYENTDIIKFVTKKKINDAYSIGIQPYRYLFMSFTDNVQKDTTSEVDAILSLTGIPWRTQDVFDVKCDIKNYVIYQKVTVTAKTTYQLPVFFGVIGLPTEFDYSAEAVRTVNDPDEFVRNADLVVDFIADVAEKTGAEQPIQKVKKKLSVFKTKVADSKFIKFFKME